MTLFSNHLLIVQQQYVTHVSWLVIL